MVRCDVLITYELKNREIENLCLVKRELERRGYRVEMRMQYETFFRSPEPLEAKLVVVPGYYRPRAQFYAASHTVKTERIVNMLWEQVFNATNEDDPHFVGAIKPWGRSAVHLAWGKHMQKRLTGQWGVAPDHARVTGHIALDFLRGPLRAYYDDRETVFARYGLPADKTVHLFISSLAYADANLRVLKSASANGDLQRPMRLAEICVQTREALIGWFERVLEENPDDLLIYRPHPEEKNNAALRALAERQPRFRIIGEEAVKQWILVCDRIYSVHSTSVAEVFAAGKGCSILRPVPFPYELDIKMYHAAPHLESYEQFAADFRRREQDMAIPEEMLREYYEIDENRYSFEKVCDVIEEALRDDRYLLDPPLRNPLSGALSPERIKNGVKRSLIAFPLMEKIYHSRFMSGSKFRELLDDVFYVKEKLAKNRVSDEEIAAIIQRIDRALQTPGSGTSEE